MQKQTYGKELTKMRERANVTQLALSKELKLSTPQFISNWERGSAKVPVTMIPKLSRALKVQPTKIVELVANDYKKTVTTEVQRLMAKPKATKTAKKAKTVSRKSANKKAKKK